MADRAPRFHFSVSKVSLPQSHAFALVVCLDVQEDFFTKLREVARNDWLLIAAGATLTSFAAGVAYMHGYLAPFGFEGLVLSLSAESYLAVGAVTVIVLFLLMGFLAMLGAALVASFAPKRLEGGFSLPRWMERIHALWVLTGAVATLVVPFVYAWRWLTPLSALFPMGDGPLVESLLLLFLAIVFVVGYPLAYLRLRGRAFTAFVVATCLMSAPALAKLAGEERAESILEDPSDAPRVLVWRNATAAPEGYIVVHQDGELLYLVVTLGRDGDGKPVFHATALRISDMARVDFLPAGADDSYATPHADGIQDGAKTS